MLALPVLRGRLPICYRHGLHSQPLDPACPAGLKKRGPGKLRHLDLRRLQYLFGAMPECHEIMLRYKLRRRDWFTDTAVGLKMFAKRKLELLPSRSKDMKTIKALFQHKRSV